MKKLLQISLFLSVLFVCLFLSLFRNPDLYFPLTLLWVSISLPFLAHPAKEPINWVEPITLLAILYALYFGGRAIYLFEFRDQLPEQILLRLPLYEEKIGQSVWYAAMGFACLWVGYRCGIADRISLAFPQIAPFRNKTTVAILIIVLYLAGTMLRLVMIERARYSIVHLYNTIDFLLGRERIYHYLTILAFYAFILALLYHFAEGGRNLFARFAVFTMFPIECLWALFSGSKFMLVSLLLSSLIIFNYYRTRVRPVHIGTLFVLISLIVFPMVAGVRKVQRVPEGGEQVVTRTLPLLRETYKTAYESFSLKQAFDQVMERAHGVDSLALIVTLTRVPGDLLYGSSFLSIPIMLVPTLFLENKDQIVDQLVRATEFATKYFPGAVEQTGIMITQIGELYRNFYLFGITLGMFFYGVLYRTFYVYFTRTRSDSGIFAYAVLFPMYVEIGHWIFSVFGEGIKQLIIVLCVIWIANFPRPFEHHRSVAPS